MHQKPNVWRIGNVTVTRIVDIEILGGHPDVIFQGLDPEQVRKISWLQPHFADAFGMLNSSIHAFVVESEGKRIIVDTCVGNDKNRHLPLFNNRKGTFLSQLSEAGFPAESIDTVLCTHLHVDHVGWNTRLLNKRWIPTFPNARYLFGRIELEYWHQKYLSGETVNTESAKILDATNVMADSVLPIIEADLHTLVEIDHHLTSEVSLMSTPGHTPGHVSVSIHSNGMEAIITGDIFHHPIEMEYPDLDCNFDVDPEAARRTRREFLTTQSGRNVMILGTHFPDPTAGRIVQNGNSWLFDISSVGAIMHNALKIKTFDGTFNAYVAAPVTTPAPVVVVIQEIFGVNFGIRKIADDLAKQGFIAVCPDLFWRFEPGLQLSDHKESDWKKGLDFYGRYDRDKGVNDIAATIAAARTLPGSNGKVGVMGFCLGGLMTFLTAARVDLDAAVEYYGGETQKYVSEGKKIKKPFLMHLAGEDEFMDKASQATINKELADNAHIKIHTYPSRNHAFARPNGDHYDSKDAETAKARTVAFFKEHLKDK